MKNLVRFALIFSFFGILLLSLQRVGSSAPQGLTLTVTEPADRSYTNQTKVIVAGNVNTEGAAVTANGTDLPVAADNTFRGQVSLPNEGPNTIEVRATVGAKSVVSVTRTVFRDTTAPTILISQPADGATIDAAQVEVRGSAADANSFTITVNGVPAKIVGGKDALWFVTMPLQQGTNLFLVRARDVAGNEVEQTRTIFVTTGNALVLQVTEPENGFLTNQSSVRVTGNINHTNGMVRVNGTLVPVNVDGFFYTEMQVPHGAQTIEVMAQDLNGNTQTQVRHILVDRQPPLLTEVSPPSGALVGTPTVTLQGVVTDDSVVTLLVGDVTQTIPPTQGSGGQPFVITNVPIEEGRNTIQIIAIDAAGNETVNVLFLTGKDHTPPSAPVILPFISPTRLPFQVIQGKTEPGALVSVQSAISQITAIALPDTGVFFIETDLAVGENLFSVKATDSSGNVSPPTQVSIVYNPALAPPDPGVAAQITVSAGNTQRGLVNTELPRPLVAIVTDRLGAPVNGLPVTFQAVEGGGGFIGGTHTITTLTNSQGRAMARYLCGPEPALNMIQATFSGNTLSPTKFIAEGLAPSLSGHTKVEGIIFDQNLRALPNVIVRLGGQQTRSAQDGRFRLENVTSGPHQILEVIGRDQVPFSGRWPNLSYDLDVLPGITNRLNRAIFLPRVNDGISLPLSTENQVLQDTVYTLPVVGGEPPIKVTIRQGTHIIFPPDISDRRFSVTRIPVDRVPMALEDGRATKLYVSVQPSGAIFDPPIEVAFPNLDREPAGNQVLLMSFDHDAGRYVQVGTGTVSADGKQVVSDPGMGIRVGAWHGFPPLAPPPTTDVPGGPCTASFRHLGLNEGSSRGRKTALNEAVCFKCSWSVCSIPAFDTGDGGFLATGVPSLLSPCSGLGVDCKEKTTLNLIIHNGQGGAPLDELQEIDDGAFTVANLNDTDGDHIIDKDDLQVVATPIGRDEVDLMKLTIQRPVPDQGGNVLLRIMSGNVRLWEKSTKEQEVTVREFPTSLLPKDVWVEATNYSQSVKDIVITAEYNEVQDTVKATAVWAVQSDVRHDAAAVFPIDDWNVTLPFPIVKRLQQSRHFGLAYNDDAAHHDFYNIIGMRFTLVPPGIGYATVSIAQFDVTRQRRFKDIGKVKLMKDVVHTDDFNDDSEKPNDDESNYVDESTVNSQQRIFSLDIPGGDVTRQPASVISFTSRNTFREFVRVSFNGMRPAGNNIAGSRCSDYFEWHARHTIVRDRVDPSNPNWVFMKRSTGDAQETDENDVGPAKIDIPSP